MPPIPAVGQVHESEEDFFSLPLSLSCTTQGPVVGCPLGCNQWWPGSCPSKAVHSSGARGIPAALLHQTAPHPPLFVAVIPPQKPTLIPCKHICHFKSVSPWEVLLYHNNLFAFPGLLRIVHGFYAACEKKEKKTKQQMPTPLPFRFLFLYLELSAKIPCENCAFIAAVYFYLAIL